MYWGFLPVDPYNAASGVRTSRSRRLSPKNCSNNIAISVWPERHTRKLAFHAILVFEPDEVVIADVMDFGAPRW